MVFETGEFERPKFHCIFLSIISSNIHFGAQMNHRIEMVLLSTHNICFGLEIRKVVYKIEGLNNAQAEIPPYTHF